MQAPPSGRAGKAPVESTVGREGRAMRRLVAMTSAIAWVAVGLVLWAVFYSFYAIWHVGRE